MPMPSEQRKIKPKRKTLVIVLNFYLFLLSFFKNISRSLPREKFSTPWENQLAVITKESLNYYEMPTIDGDD